MVCMFNVLLLCNKKDKIISFRKMDGIGGEIISAK